MDSSMQKCRYNYLGCYYDTKNSFIMFSQFKYNQFFVDICVTRCNYKNYKYSSVFKFGNESYCNCLNSVSLSELQACDLYCLGKNKEQYSCGSSINSNNRAIYYNIGN